MRTDTIRLLHQLTHVSRHVKRPVNMHILDVTAMFYFCNTQAILTKSVAAKTLTDRHLQWRDGILFVLAFNYCVV